MQEQVIARTNYATDTHIAHGQPATLQTHQTNVASFERVASVLARSVLGVYGLRRRPYGLLLTLIGGGLIYRGISGHCPVYQQLGITSANPSEEQQITKAITINRPIADLYHIWDTVEALPYVLQHLESVQVIDPLHTHWVGKGSLGMPIAWDSVLTQAVQDSHISWSSLPEAPIHYTGIISFVVAPGNRGTEVRFSLNYGLPGGVYGELAAQLLAGLIGQLITEELRGFKQLVETGQRTRTSGQSADHQLHQTNDHPDADEVLQGSMDSFPASDPPAWLAGNQEKES